MGFSHQVSLLPLTKPEDELLPVASLYPDRVYSAPQCTLLLIVVTHSLCGLSPCKPVNDEGVIPKFQFLLCNPCSTSTLARNHLASGFKLCSLRVNIYSFQLSEWWSFVLGSAYFIWAMN